MEKIGHVRAFMTRGYKMGKPQKRKTLVIFEEKERKSE
jgi:hypothetical protein